MANSSLFHIYGVMGTAILMRMGDKGKKEKRKKEKGERKKEKEEGGRKREKGTGKREKGKKGKREKGKGKRERKTIKKRKEKRGGSGNHRDPIALQIASFLRALPAGTGFAPELDRTRLEPEVGGLELG